MYLFLSMLKNNILVLNFNVNYFFLSINNLIILMYYKSKKKY